MSAVMEMRKLVIRLRMAELLLKHDKRCLVERIKDGPQNEVEAVRGYVKAHILRIANIRTELSELIRKKV